MARMAVRVVLGMLWVCAGVSAGAVLPASLRLHSCAWMETAGRSALMMGDAAGHTTVRSGVVGALLGARAQAQGLRLRGGAKSKNHTNHNQNHKAHRNGIKRVKTHRHESTKFRAIKMWRNTKYSRKGSMRIHRRALQEQMEAKASSLKESESAEAAAADTTMEA